MLFFEFCYSVLHEASNSIGHFLTSSKVIQVVLSNTNVFSGIFWPQRLYCRRESAQAKSKEVRNSVMFFLNINSRYVLP